MLEMTLEGSLDSKEIISVIPKGNYLLIVGIFSKEYASMSIYLESFYFTWLLICFNAIVGIIHWKEGC